MYKCAYTWPVSYEWDPAKARANFAKHGVRFADAVTVLEDDLAPIPRQTRKNAGSPLEGMLWAG